MSKRSKTVREETQSGVKPARREAILQMGSRLLLVLIGVLQLVAIVQSESPADTVLHGSFLLVLIVFGTRKAKNRKKLHGRG